MSDEGQDAVLLLAALVDSEGGEVFIPAEALQKAFDEAGTKALVVDLDEASATFRLSVLPVADLDDVADGEE